MRVHSPNAHGVPSSPATRRDMGAGLGVKPSHWAEVLALDDAPHFWVEVHAENHMVDGGPRLAALDALRAKHPLSLHGVGLSLAGEDPLDVAHLARLKRLVDRCEPWSVSEHLSWCKHDGTVFPDLLPVVRTPAACQRIAARITQVQEALGRPIAIENPTHYLSDMGHTLSEDVFLNELADRCGNTWLLDITNVVISAHNTAGTTESVDTDWIFRLRPDTVSEIHLAGFSDDAQAMTATGLLLRIDSHSHALGNEVRALYKRYVAFAGPRPSLVEWDNDVPPFEALWRERTWVQSVLTQARPSE